jgi:hypothetical protein
MNTQHCGKTTFKGDLYTYPSFFAVRRRPNDEEGALCLVLEPGLHVDVVDPKVDILLGR